MVWDPRVNLLTSQGPGTSIDFALKMIDLLVGREKAYEGRLTAGDGRWHL